MKFNYTKFKSKLTFSTICAMRLFIFSVLTRWCDFVYLYHIFLLQIIMTKLSDKERARKYRERKWACPVYKEKERLRKKAAQLQMTKEQKQDAGEASKERMRRYQQHLKGRRANLNPVTPSRTVARPRTSWPFTSRQSFGKAMPRSQRGLPKSPRKSLLELDLRSPIRT